MIEAKVDTNQVKAEAKKEANNDKFEALRGMLVS
jgi:hypothetical protein